MLAARWRWSIVTVAATLGIASFILNMAMIGFYPPPHSICRSRARSNCC